MLISEDAPDIETSSKKYAGRFEGPVGKWMLHMQWNAVNWLIYGTPGKRVLEIGGGHAQITGSLLDHGYNVTVLGSNADCGRLIEPLIEPGHCDFVVGDLLSLPFADSSFDTAVALRLMAHMKFWQRFLHEATRVARHTVIIDYPSLFSINLTQKLLFNVKKAIEHNTRPYQCFTTQTIEDTCQTYGFKHDGQVKQFFMPMVLHRIMRIPWLSNVAENACRKLGLTKSLGSPAVLRLSCVRKSSANNIRLQDTAA